MECGVLLREQMLSILYSSHKLNHRALVSATATTDLDMKMEFVNCFKCWLSKADFVRPSGFQNDKVILLRRRCGVLQLC